MSHKPLQTQPQLSEILSVIKERGAEQYLNMRQAEQRRVEEKELKVPYALIHELSQMYKILQGTKVEVNNDKEVTEYYESNRLKSTISTHITTNLALCKSLKHMYLIPRSGYEQAEKIDYKKAEILQADNEAVINVCDFLTSANYYKYSHYFTQEYYLLMQTNSLSLKYELNIKYSDYRLGRGVQYNHFWIDELKEVMPSNEDLEFLKDA